MDVGSRNAPAGVFVGGELRAEFRPRSQRELEDYVLNFATACGIVDRVLIETSGWTSWDLELTLRGAGFATKIVCSLTRYPH